MNLPNLTMGTDSLEYEFLYEAALNSLDANGISCELGVRRGGSTELILRASMTRRPIRPHVAIDPWGNIPYFTGDAPATKLDYTDAMRRKAMRDLYQFAFENTVDLYILPWMDIDFFERCADGIPLYTETYSTRLWKHYSLVHFDGPHDVPSILKEVEFFGPRSPKGAYWVFDDIENYDHKTVDARVKEFGFTTVQYGRRKASYTLPEMTFLQLTYV